MILDIILIVLLVFMMLYGYKKGLIGIVAKLVSLLVALVLAYILAESVGEYIATTSLGNNIQANIENVISTELSKSEQGDVVVVLQEKLNIPGNAGLIDKLISYVFTGIGFIFVYIISRIVLWIVQKILESVFELPVLKTFNKLGGVIASAILFVVEIAILLAVIKSVSTLAFMSKVVDFVGSSVITKTLYDHNIFTSLILSKII